MRVMRVIRVRFSRSYRLFLSQCTQKCTRTFFCCGRFLISTNSPRSKGTDASTKGTNKIGANTHRGRRRPHCATLMMGSKRRSRDAALEAPWASLAVLDFEANCVPAQGRDSEAIARFGPGCADFQQEIVEVPTVMVLPRARGAEDDVGNQEEGPCAAGFAVFGEFHAYVRPALFPITPFCTHLTGVTEEMLPQAGEAAGSFECVWKEWRRFLSDFDRPLVCTCGDWDLKAMLPQQLKLCGIGEGAAVRRWCNVKKCYEKLYGKKAGGMTRMLESLGMDLDGRHHSGIDDSRNIAKLVIRMLQDGAAKGLAPHEVIFATS